MVHLDERRDLEQQAVAELETAGFAVQREVRSNGEELSKLWPPRAAWSTTWREHEWMGEQ